MELMVTNMLRNMEALLADFNYYIPKAITQIILDFVRSDFEIFNQKLSENDAIKKCLDYFFHLKSEHDHEFDKIYHDLGGKCDVNTCTMVKRSFYRKYSSNILEYDCNQCIIDKIHCYFQHSYDCGYRFTPEENKMIENIESKYDNDDDNNDEE